MGIGQAAADGLVAVGARSSRNLLQVVEDVVGVGDGLQPQSAALMKQGGLILHGEEEFEYHRPLVVGDVLEGEGKVTDIYEKDSRGKTMTFLVTENLFKDAKTGEPVLTTRMNLIHRS